MSSFHELSDQLFDVREKLSSDEYNNIYKNLMLLEQQKTVVTEDENEPIQSSSGGDEDFNIPFEFLKFIFWVSMMIPALCFDVGCYLVDWVYLKAYLRE